MVADGQFQTKARQATKTGCYALCCTLKRRCLTGCEGASSHGLRSCSRNEVAIPRNRIRVSSLRELRELRGTRGTLIGVLLL